MQTFRNLLCLLLIACWAAPAVAAQPGNEAMPEALANFLRQRNVSELSIGSIPGENSGDKKCVKSQSHVVCLGAKSVSNATIHAEAGIYKALQASARLALIDVLSTYIPDTIFANYKAAQTTFREQTIRANKNYVLKGIETSTFKSGNRYFAVVAYPISNIDENVRLRSQARYFANDYCAFLYPEAKNRFERQDFAGALQILKEAHELKWARADAYIMAAKCFSMIGERQDAEKMAIETLGQLRDQLDAELAEDLGNILLALGRDNEARQAFEIAINALGNQGMPALR